MNVALLRARAAVLSALRATLGREGFLEVQPPVLVRSPALEANLEGVACADGFLHTSPEFALKRVLAAGLPRIYAMVPSFRSEEAGRHHSREFTMLELYLNNANYLDLIPLVEALVLAAAAALGVAIPNFTRTTVAELFGGDTPPDDDEFFRRWVTEVDPRLTAPTWVLDFPARHAALAEVRGDVCERLELYLGGLELANGYSELRDGVELRRRFAQSAKVRLESGRSPHPTDEGVISASDRFPRTAGIAIGIDRLVMALTDTSDIADVQIER